MTLEEAFAIEDRILKLIDKNFWPEYHEAVQVIRANIITKEQHKKHPNHDECVYCHSQWPCEESNESKGTD